MTTTIDPKAPVSATGSIDIDAPPEVVWNLLTDIVNWPRWNPDVTEARLSGDLAPGSEFVWKAGPGTIRSTLLEVEPPESIAWSGRTMGIEAVHIWSIEPNGSGSTLSTSESWRGLLPRLLKGAMGRTLDKAIQAGLQAAKVAVEAA